MILAWPVGPALPALSEWAWIVLLMIAGGALEMGGLVVLFVEVRKDAQALGQFLHRPQVVRPGTAEMIAQAMPVTVKTDPDTLDNRVQRLEGLVAGIRTELKDLEVKQWRKWKRDIDEALERVQLSFRDYTTALEKLITGSSLGLRILGVGLFLAGLLCSVWANVWAMARSG